MRVGQLLSRSAAVLCIAALPTLFAQSFRGVNFNPPWRVAADPVASTTFDVDGNGDTDVVAAFDVPQLVAPTVMATYVLNPGTGGAPATIPPALFTVADFPGVQRILQIVPVDLDQDGIPDLLVETTSSSAQGPYDWYVAFEAVEKLASESFRADRGPKARARRRRRRSFTHSGRRSLSAPFLYL